MIREIECRHIIITQDVVNDRAAYRIRNLLNGYSRVLCVAVVGLAHVVHDDLQRTRCDLSRIGNGRRHARCRRRCARARDVNDLIVVRIVPCERCRIGDILRRDIARNRIVGNVLALTAAKAQIHRRGVVRALLRDAVMCHPAGKGDDRVLVRHSDAVAVRMCRKPVVDLLDAVRLRMKRGSGNRPVCCNVGGVCVVDIFEIF